MRTPEEIEAAVQFLQMARARIAGEATNETRYPKYLPLMHALGKIEEALRWAGGEDNDFGQMLEACEAEESLAARSGKQ